MAQQTAVEWYTEQLRKLAFDANHHLGLGDIRLTQGQIDELCEQAKQMEKEQISKAWDDGDYAYFYSKETGRDFTNGEQYYNETYNK